MGLLSLFRKTRKAGLDDAEVFMERNSAFLVQKSIFEYSRARAGVLSYHLFKEEAFKRAVEEARWRAFPVGLRLVAEMVEGQLRPHVAPDEAPRLLDRVTGLAMRVIARHEAPAVLASGEWEAAREAVRLRLARLQLHPPKRVKDIPVQDTDEIFGLMPIHESLRLNDRQLVQNNLRVNLCRIYEDFVAETDVAALAARAVETEAAGDPTAIRSG